MHPSSPSTGATALRGVSVALVTAAIVATFDALLLSRVRAGTDNALRLSVVLPYAGVGSRYVLARACGLAALVLTGAAVGLGLETGRRRAAGEPGAATLNSLHRQLSVVAIALVVAHVLLPYTSSVTPFGGWPTALVPFDEPYSFGVRGKVFESFGIVAFYLVILLGPSYYLLRRHRWVWDALHSLTVAAYGLAVLHALFLGSDFVLRGPTRVALLAVQLPLTVLLARRLLAGDAAGTRRLAGVAAVALSATVVVLSAAGIAGASLGGLPV